MLLPSRVAGRTLGLRGPDLARGPEVARLWPRPTGAVSKFQFTFSYYHPLTHSFLAYIIL